MYRLLLFAVLHCAFTAVTAHPGHNVGDEAAERLDFMKRGQPNSVRSCASKLAKRNVLDYDMSRRTQLAHDLRVKKGLTDKPILRRDFASYNFSHAYTEDNISFGDDELNLFTDNSTCILQPEVTQGPYYIDGELIRKDVRETQDGVDLFLDVQFIDTSTCEPIPALYVDLWHCNSTGVYSGIVASGNGVGEDDPTNINNTFLRGIQATDLNGIVQFETLFPGHYTGRATHIHILAHAANATTVRTNGTILGNNGTIEASHVGQLFFDQDLISLVNEASPYSSNTQNTTLNSEDSILASEADTMDPFVEYILLGDKIEDGILGWISIGIDPTADSKVSTAATIYAEGGQAHENAMGGGGGTAGMPGNGTGAPDGTAPTMSA